jgi:hypothetical protein
MMETWVVVYSGIILSVAIIALLDLRRRRKNRQS